MKLENRQALYATSATLLIGVGAAITLFSRGYEKIIIGLVMCAIGGAVYFKHFKSTC